MFVSNPTSEYIHIYTLSYASSIVEYLGSKKRTFGNMTNEILFVMFSNRFPSIYQNWILSLSMEGVIFWQKIIYRVFNLKAPNLDILKMRARVLALIFNWVSGRFTYVLNGKIISFS